MFKKLQDQFKAIDLDLPITVVSGLPRSGTSMMMKMLEAGGISTLTDEFRTADDDNPKGYYEFERVKKLRDGDSKWLPEARGKAVKVIATLLPYLPEGYDYRVLFMRRAMSEILASQRTMLIRREEDPDKVSDEQLSNLYNRHLQQVQVWLASQGNISLLDVDFKKMVEDPNSEVAAVNNFLRGELNEEKMIAAVDPKLYRQRS